MPTWTMEARQPDQTITMNGREHYRRKARTAASWRKHAWAHALRDLKRPHLAEQLAAVQVDFGVPDVGRRRDPHNWAPTVKPILDGLTDAKVWTDDDFKHVAVLPSTFYRSTVPTYRVTITWDDDA